MSPERIEKLKQRDHSHLTRYGKDNGFYGKKHSEKTRNIISEKNKGNTYSRGRIMPPESRLKISKANTGNKNCIGREMSEETRNKIRKSLYKIVVDIVTGEEFESVGVAATKWS